jgi:DNA polymerase-2
VGEILNLPGFILSRHWKDRYSGVEIVLWLSTDEGPLKVTISNQKSIFFVAETQLEEAEELLKGKTGWHHKKLELRDFRGEAALGFYFSSQKTCYQCRDLLVSGGVEVYEGDIGPANRYLMERFARGSVQLRGNVRQAPNYLHMDNPVLAGAEYSPQLKLLSVDIETAIDRVELYSIGVYGKYRGHRVEYVFMVGARQLEKLPEYIRLYSDEKSMLLAFLEWLDSYDPDVIIGWNVVNFDMRYLQRIADKYRVSLSLGREKGEASWRRQDDDVDRYQLSVPGRAVLDGIELLRAATYRFKSFSLETVSRELLGESKLLKGKGRSEQISALFENDKASLAQYNIKDCCLVWDIFQHTSLLEFAIARSHMTGLALDRMGGSVASFDNLYLPCLHREGFVAPNASRDLVGSPGGLVMNSQPGIYNNVLVLDFKSLYPSIIRTFAIDPMGLVLPTLENPPPEFLIPGFLGAEFSRDRHLLPNIIGELWQSRDKAKSAGNVAMSQAIKIIMNSFYGVLGTPACRFFDARLASSITLRGHEILQLTRKFIEDRGYPVVYGDTDSVFVWAEDAVDEAEALKVGHELALGLNHWWEEKLDDEYGIKSILEIEFETLYSKFLMPTVRGSDKGSKKRYAGVINTKEGPSLVFKGLENVRTDWTAIAREFQMELYRRVFFEEPYRDYISEITAEVTEGRCDQKLVYRKRLRRKLDDYQRNIPPHVQAARLARERGISEPKRGDWIEYVISLQGAEPADHQQSPLDYQHYIDSQLAPVADGILYFLDASFAEITGRQINLF